jgi:hypothetical protein
VPGTGSEAGEKKATARLTSKLTSRLKTARVQLPAKKGAGAPPVAKPSASAPTGRPAVAKPSTAVATAPTKVVSASPASGGVGMIPAVLFGVASAAWAGMAAFTYFS